MFPLNYTLLQVSIYLSGCEYIWQASDKHKILLDSESVLHDSAAGKRLVKIGCWTPFLSNGYLVITDVIFLARCGYDPLLLLGTWRLGTKNNGIGFFVVLRHLFALGCSKESIKIQDPSILADKSVIKALQITCPSSSNVSFPKTVLYEEILQCFQAYQEFSILATQSP